MTMTLMNSGGSAVGEKSPAPGAAVGDRKKTTAAGTPCAKSWDAAWISQVEASEERLGRRICGARTIPGPPCELSSSHATGRCAFHGGFAMTGAVPGNRNAVIHAMYSRRLRPCSIECPMWRSCPCASPEVAALKPDRRPICYFEQLEYDTVLTDALGRASVMPGFDPLRLHVAHSVALLQVLLSRGAQELGARQLVDAVLHFRETTEKAPGFSHDYAKPSAPLVAFLRIANEYRRFAAMLETKTPGLPAMGDMLGYLARTAVDTSDDPDVRELLHEPMKNNLSAARNEMLRSLQRKARGDGSGAAESAQRARDCVKWHRKTENESIELTLADEYAQRIKFFEELEPLFAVFLRERELAGKPVNLRENENENEIASPGGPIPGTGVKRVAKTLMSSPPEVQHVFIGMAKSFFSSLGNYSESTDDGDSTDTNAPPS